MEKRTKPSILQNFDCEVTALIAQNRGISQTEALRRFLNSKTHEMLEDDDMKLWYFSPLAVLATLMMSLPCVVLACAA